LEQFFEIGKEMVVYQDVDDLADKIRYYLRHETEREAIAEAGYRRVLRDHSYAQRFREIFSTIGYHLPR
jgi:spore maturation protein CgeB